MNYQFNIFEKKRAGMEIKQGCLLRVNLSTGDVVREPINKSYQQLLFAGRGLAIGYL
jgi:aldehyde:ferredoxin oxidoreductase